MSALPYGMQKSSAAVYSWQRPALTDASAFNQHPVAEGLWIGGGLTAAIGGLCLWRTFRKLNSEYFDPDDPEREPLDEPARVVEITARSIIDSIAADSEAA